MDKDYLLNQILKYTKSEHSINFYRKAVKLLGEGRVEMELGELKHQIRLGKVKNPAKYLTTLLKKQINEISETKSATPDRKITHFEKTQQDLFRHLMPIEVPKDKLGESKKMPVPYSGKNIPWTTFIGPEFFTLSTNKKRSDKVIALFRSLEGTVTKSFLTRGKISPDSKEEYGIPNVQHWRVFSALKLAWSQKDRQNYTQYDNGTLICYLTISAKELAKILGWKNWQHLSKKDLCWLRDIVTKLKAMPYYLHLEDSDLKGISGYGFYLIGDISLINRKADRGRETLFSISFSSTVSWQLLQRHAVIRSKEMLFIRNELSSLLWLYLEPNLRAHNEAYINLNNLIEVLQLPKADWHKYSGRRKSVFEKAIKELNGQKLADGRKMIVEIKKGLKDWQLVARLEGYAIKQLE